MPIAEDVPKSSSVFLAPLVSIVTLIGLSWLSGTCGKDIGAISGAFSRIHIVKNSSNKLEVREAHEALHLKRGNYEHLLPWNKRETDGPQLALLNVWTPQTKTNQMGLVRGPNIKT